jgi:methylmalonyl-CoA mutase cobalamin-binding domain/chain
MMPQSLHALIGFLLEGDQAKAAKETRRLLEAGVGREAIVSGAIEEAMRQLDSKCTLEEFNLLEIMLAGRAATEVLRILYPRGEARREKGTVVLATPRGDVHDLGKNVVKSILVSSGYNVIDCGKDVPTERILQAAQRERARVVGVSGLVTSAIAAVRELRPAMSKNGVDCLLVAGGAALCLCTPESLDVDHVARDAFDGVGFINGRLGR